MYIYMLIFLMKLLYFLYVPQMAVRELQSNKVCIRIRIRMTPLHVVEFLRTMTSF